MTLTLSPQSFRRCFCHRRGGGGLSPIQSQMQYLRKWQLKTLSPTLRNFFSVRLFFAGHAPWLGTFPYLNIYLRLPLINLLLSKVCHMKSKDGRTVDCGLVPDSAHITDQYVVAVTVILLIKIAGSQVRFVIIYTKRERGLK